MIIALLVVVSTSLIFFETLVTHAVAWQLEKKFAYTEREFAPGHLIYMQPTMKGAEADRLTVTITARVWPFKLKVKGRLDHPTLQSYKRPTPKQGKSFWRRIPAEVELVDGEVGGGTLNGVIRLTPRLSGSLRVRDVTMTNERWELTGASGGLVLSGDEMTVAIDGQLRYRDQECSLKVAGRTGLGPKTDLSLGLTWGDGASTALQMCGDTVQLELDQVGHGQAVVLQTIARDYLPALRHINLTEGHLSASIRAEMEEGRLREIEVNRFSSEKLSFSYPPLGLKGSLAAASGKLRADVTPSKKFTHIGGDVEIADGQIAFQDGFELSDVQGRVRVRNNVLRGGELTGQWNGLRASARLGHMTPKGRVTVTLEGRGEDFGSWIPDTFKSDNLKVEGGIWQEGSYLQVEGVGTVNNDRLPFGLRLHHKSGHRSHPWVNLALEMIGYPSFPLLPIETVGLCLESGWLRAEGVDAARYVQPVLKSDDMHISGEVDFLARLKEKEITVDYSGRNVSLDANRFQVFVPEIDGLHSFSLVDGTEIGSIPIQHGIYLEKSTGLLFTDTTCQVELNDGHLDVHDIETTCEELHFEGRVIVDAPHILIFSPQVEGPVEGAQRILQTICPDSSFDLPLAGNVATTGDGFILRLFLGQSDKTECQISGELTHPAYSGAFAYDHADHSLAITRLSLGGPKVAVRDGAIRVSGFPKGTVELTLPITKAGAQIVCVEGSLRDNILSLKTAEGGLTAALAPLDNGWEISSLSASYKGKQVESSEPFSCALSDRLQLRNANLEIGGHPILFRSVSLNFSNQGPRTQAIARLKERDYWLTLLGNELVISELGAEATSNPVRPLTLTLSPHITAARGTLRGFTFDLKASDQRNHFEGTVANQDGYRLSGHFSAAEDDWTALSFNGQLLANNFTCLNHHLSSLRANLSFSPRELTLSSLRLNDPSGALQINRLSARKDTNDIWQFHGPHLTFQSFRPSILSHIDGRPIRPRTFTLTEGEIHHLMGNSSGTHTWTGLGSFSFINPPKHSPAGTPFAIPDQILGKLGLDLGALVPSFGKVSFHVRNDYIFLSNFDNVFSRSHRSQFFLDPARPSSIGLNGRLSLHFRMKQNNLLLKLTERFNLAVGGTLEKPRYGLEPRT